MLRERPYFSAAAADALRGKRAFAERAGARLRIVTQFGFDMPIHMGVAGPAKITTLVRYATLCGVGNSLSMRTRHTGSLMSLATGYSPETFVAPLEKRRQGLATIAQIHVFPFGGLDKAAAWLRKRGSW